MSVRNGLLALLASNPRHGYELKKELEERTGSLWELNIGQVYTTLSRLERDGLVVEVDGAHPSSGPQDQRQYALTDAGRQVVREWFAEPRSRPSPDRDELVIKLTIAAGLDGSAGLGVDLDEVIDAQRVVTTEELQRYTRLKAAAAPDDVARLFALDAVTAQIEAELRWLDQCQQRYGQHVHDQQSHGQQSHGQLRGRGAPRATTRTTNRRGKGRR